LDEDGFARFDVADDIIPSEVALFECDDGHDNVDRNTNDYCTIYALNY
jgi:hypothetical protein